MMYYISMIILTVYCGQTTEANDAPVSTVIAGFKSAIENAKAEKSASIGISDDSVALAVEWIRLRDSVASVRFQRKADYFLGYVGGRLRVTPPEWWCKAIRSGGAENGKAWFFDYRRIRKHWKHSPSGVRFSGFDSIEIGQDELILQHRGHSVALRKRDFAEIGADRAIWSVDVSAIAGSIDDKLCAVAFECPEYGVGGPHKIFCVDVRSGKTMWSHDLRDGLLPGTGYSGAYNGCYAEVVLDDDRVIVWSGHDVAICCEMFRKADGKRIASFQPSYLDGIHLGEEMK